jgi:hypothetical protein
MGQQYLLLLRCVNTQTAIMRSSILLSIPFISILSPSEVILAIFIFVMSRVLAWAAIMVIHIAKRSAEIHKNPAYVLYWDPTALNRWRFLYIQFGATTYYFILPTLVYILGKSMLVALAEGAGTVHAMVLLSIEAIALIAASIFRPWMG